MNVLLISVQRNLDIIGLKGLHHLLLDKGHASVLLYLPRFDAANPRHVAGLTSFVAQVSPGLVGVSLMANDYHVAVRVTQCLKKALPAIPCVWGGIHPTTAPEMCLEHADYVCVGEGEQTLLDMATAIEQHQSLAEIPNLCSLEKGNLRRNSLYPLITDLDALPVIRQIPPNSFVQIDHQVTPLEAGHLRRFKRYRGGVHKVITSRGCPYGCSYCCNHFLRKLYGQWSVRRRSPGHIMTELEMALREGPRLEYVDFIDDCFLASDLDYLASFCVEYKARVGRPFIAKGTPVYFTREKMDLLVDAGLAWANMGLQSGSDRVCRDVYARRTTSEEFLKAARLLHEYPVAPYYDVIVDNPFETVEDSLDTVATLMAAPRPFYLLMFSMNFYHGTDLRERALNEHPEAVDDALAKDYLVRSNRLVNDLIEMAPMMHGRWMRSLVAQFRRHPHAGATRLALTAATVYCRVVLAPLAYVRLIRRSQGGSLWRTLKVLPLYINGALVYYKNNFPWFRRDGATASGGS